MYIISKKKRLVYMHIVHVYCYLYCSVLWPGGSGSGYHTCDMGITSTKGCVQRDPGGSHG